MSKIADALGKQEKHCIFTTSALVPLLLGKQYGTTNY